MEASVSLALYVGLYCFWLCRLYCLRFLKISGTLVFVFWFLGCECWVPYHGVLIKSERQCRIYVWEQVLHDSWLQEGSYSSPNKCLNNILHEQERESACALWDNSALSACRVQQTAPMISSLSQAELSLCAEGYLMHKKKKSK